MSMTYHFEINLTQRRESNLSATDLIECLIAAGWSLFSGDGAIIYTDVHDNDAFDYLSKPIKKAEYYDIVRKKQEKKETIAFVMFRSEHPDRYRIDVIITPMLEVLISPDDGTRKMLSDEWNILDVNWYLMRILPYFNSERMLVEGFSYTQL